ncbi:MAG TPA: glycoside hydrolase family 31 protein, partial [Phycisphaerae bacterium]|nr:glycoside hydrolase family 31 protein [Phycisphaerae bacterium]
PVLRTHTTKNPEAERRIWKFPKPYFEAMRAAFSLRYALIPYIYSAARQCYDTGLPLCRPLYYAWPDTEEAYQHTGEYLFGDDLLVAPVTEPASAFSGCSELQVWIPPGQWVNWFTDEVYDGPALVPLQVPLNEIPLFARAGAIIPAGEAAQRSATPGPLVLHVFTGDAGKTVLYEDDGISDGYASGNFARTKITRANEGTRCNITIAAAEGPYAEKLPVRDVELRLHAFFPDQPGSSVQCNGQPVPQRTGDEKSGWWFDPEQVQFVIRLPQMDPRKAAEITIDTGYAGGAGVPVRRGLRGRIQAVRDVEAMLGISPPKEVPGAAAVRAEFDQCKSLDRAAVASALAWNMTMKRLREAQLSNTERSRALVRLLGLVPRVRLTPATNGTGAVLHVALGLERADALLGVPNWSAEVRFDPPHHLELPPADDLRFERVAVTRTLSKDIAIAGPSSAQTDVLRGAINVRLNDTTLDVPIDMVVLPSINRWWLVGPFDAPMQDRLQTVFPPERKLDLAAEYTGKGDAPIRWQRVERTITPDSDLTDEFFVEFHKYFGQLYYDAVAYGLTYLESPREMDASLAFGSDDGIVIWLNGKEVHRHDVGRAYTPRQDRVAIHLNEGVNTLMVKISQGGGMWGFGMHVETPDGAPLPEVRVLLDKPVEGEKPAPDEKSGS